MSSRPTSASSSKGIIKSSPSGSKGGLQSIFFGADGSDDSESKMKVSQDFIIEYPGPAANAEVASLYISALRVDNLILHSPRKLTKPMDSKYPPYNIILHRGSSTESPATMFSLFRSHFEAESARTFHIYAQIFPDLIKASTSPLRKPVLENIIRMANQYPSYSAVHVAAALNKADLLRSHTLRMQMNKKSGQFFRTPLQVACIHGNLEAFETIMELTHERFMDHLKHVDYERNTICHLAASCKTPTMGGRLLRLLKQKILQRGGAKGEAILLYMFQKQNEKGFAPIHLACISKNLEAVEELSSVWGSADKQTASRELLDVKASNGYTPLHCATTSPVILTRLLTLGANPNVTDNDGLTPLHKAVVMRELKSTLQLLANKANPNFAATSSKYKSVTPLHLAAGVCDVDYMKALMVFGAKKGLKDGNGRTPKSLVEALSNVDRSLKQEALSLFFSNLETTNKEMKDLYRKLAKT